MLLLWLIKRWWHKNNPKKADDDLICLGIEMSSYMSDKAVLELADYYYALLENRSVTRAKHPSNMMKAS